MNRWAVAARSAHIFAVVLVSVAQVTAFAAPTDTIADRIFGNAFELPPVAAFDQNALGFEVTFADQSSDPAGTVGAWAWDFGDGSTATVQNPVHNFAAAGTYAVSETVFDASGESGVTSKSVIVVPCGTLTSYLHDFNYSGTPVNGHPDFESFTCGVTTGLVTANITPGGLPGFGPNGHACITSPTTFAQWYTDDPINYPIQQTLVLAEGPAGTYSYSSNAYFPIDGEGFNSQTNVDCSGGGPHNFSFTTMLHTQFKYNGGETFSFTGDDDFWMYIDGHLAIDVGGVHGSTTGTVTLDAPQAAALGITPGQIYRVDIFQAQRHTCASDFTLHTTACLSDAH